MSDHGFFIAHLRFVATKTERITPEVGVMMDVLASIADQVERGGCFRIEGENLRIAARALAGLAGFLQKQILPEVVAAKNILGERQVRWVIDTSMEMTASLTMHAETTSDGTAMDLHLPAPPTLDA